MFLGSTLPLRAAAWSAKLALKGAYTLYIVVQPQFSPRKALVQPRRSPCCSLSQPNPCMTCWTTLLLAAHSLTMTRSVSCTLLKGLLPLHAETSGADLTAGLECTRSTGGSAGHGCQVHSAQPAECLQALISRVQNSHCIAAFAVNRVAWLFGPTNKKYFP